ncbi:hypothetical protein AVEN_179831-1, partial [Araneus ventricosus]
MLVSLLQITPKVSKRPSLVWVGSLERGVPVQEVSSSSDCRLELQ